MRQVLARDVRTRTLELVPLNAADKREAITLIEQYGVSSSLRTLDAMQLAIMKRQGLDHIARVYCADQQFVAVVEAEGFVVNNPERTSES